MRLLPFDLGHSEALGFGRLEATMFHFAALLVLFAAQRDVDDEEDRAEGDDDHLQEEAGRI